MATGRLLGDACSDCTRCGSVSGQWDTRAGGQTDGARLRPSNLPDALIAPDERIFHNSFPSGHTTTAFALAFWVFLLTYRTRYQGWGYGALLLAGLVGLSRVYRGVHYPSDVLAGAAVGVVWGALVYLTLSRRAPVRQRTPPVG